MLLNAAASLSLPYLPIAGEKSPEKYSFSELPCNLFTSFEVICFSSNNRIVEQITECSKRTWEISIFCLVNYNFMLYVNVPFMCKNVCTFDCWLHQCNYTSAVTAAVLIDIIASYILETSTNTRQVSDTSVYNWLNVIVTEINQDIQFP